MTDQERRSVTVETLAAALAASRDQWFVGDRDSWSLAEPEGMAHDIFAALPHDATEPAGPLDDNEYVWLIERQGPLPYENEGRTGWTADPLQAHRYATKQEADDQRRHRSYTAESVQHGFIPSPPGAPREDERRTIGGSPGRRPPPPPPPEKG